MRITILLLLGFLFLAHATEHNENEHGAAEPEPEGNENEEHDHDHEHEHDDGDGAHKEHEKEQHWGYEAESRPNSIDPKNWGDLYPECDEQRQSPIDIHTGSAIPADIPPLRLTYYFSKPKKMIIKNNGHTAQLEVEAELLPTLQGGAYHDKFQFLQLHFHWGSDSSRGSEHSIDGKSFPLEMHLVHYNTKYSSVNEVLKNHYVDGLGVLGIFFEESKSDNPVLDTLLEGLERIPEPGNITEIKHIFSVGSLLPHNLNDFYIYSGSLTTPGCFEIVKWTVLSDPVPISRSQLNRFRSLRFGPHGRMINNYRPSQAHMGRNVFYRSGSSQGIATAITVVATFLLVILFR